MEELSESLLSESLDSSLELTLGFFFTGRFTGVLFLGGGDESESEKLPA